MNFLGRSVVVGIIIYGGVLAVSGLRAEACAAEPQEWWQVQNEKKELEERFEDLEERIQALEDEVDASRQREVEEDLDDFMGFLEGTKPPPWLKGIGVEECDDCEVP
jgi:hypothetical protein